MPDFRRGDVSLHYEDAGDSGGSPVLLVHGFASDYHLNWVGSRWQTTLADAGYRVLGLDCRGHGSSDKPRAPDAYGPATMALDALGLLDHLGIASARWIGYSMGARICLQATLLDRGRLRCCVLGGLGANGRVAEADAIVRRLGGDETVTQPIALRFHAFASSRPVNDLLALSSCMAAFGAEDLDPEAVAAFALPTLLVVGSVDDLAPGARELADRLAADYLELPGRDHMNAITSRDFKSAALAFLAEPGG